MSGEQASYTLLTFEEKCIDIFSDFFDDLEAISVQALSTTENNIATNNKREGNTAGEAMSLLQTEWLGIGANAAELEAEALHSAQHHDESLSLCMTDAEERREVLQHAARLRQQVMVDVCATLIPPLRSLRTHAATAAKSPQWTRAFHRLVCSQTTRECWLYPLRQIFPQGPVLVAKRILDLFHRFLATDVGPGGTSQQLDELESFVTSATFEIALSPAGMIRRSFPLLEAIVEVTLGLARAKLSAAIAIRFGNCSSTETSHEGAHKSVVDDARDCLIELQRRVTFVARAVNGTESAWCFIMALVRSCADTAEIKLQQSYSGESMITATRTAWAEVLQALNMWLSVPSSLHLTELSKMFLSSVQQADKLFRERQECFLPQRTRDKLVIDVGVALSQSLPETRKRLLYVDRIAHLASLPLHSRFCKRGGEGDIIAELMKRANGLMLPRNRTPSMPEWMQPDCEVRGLTALDRIGWASRCFGDNPEFPSLHPDRGRITAERVIAFYSLTTRSAQHTRVYREWCQQVPTLRKYFRLLFIRSPMISAQLDDIGTSDFMSALIPLLLEDPTASSSKDVFRVDAFDIVADLGKVLPLGWTFDSVHRLDTFVQEHIVGFTTVGGDADNDGGAEQLRRIEGITSIAALVFTAVSECIVNALVTARSAFESRGSDERYDGAMCFSSEDAAIFEAFLKTLHDMLSVEFTLHMGPSRVAEVRPKPLSDFATMSGVSPLFQSADFPSPPSSEFQTSVQHHQPHHTGKDLWSEYGEWSVATVAPSALSRSVAPMIHHGGQSPNTSPLMMSHPPPPPHAPTQHRREVLIGLDARLLPLYLPWMKWVVQDLLVAPRMGDEFAPILSSDASMHLSCGHIIGDFLIHMVSRDTWSVGTLMTLCSVLEALCPAVESSETTAGQRRQSSVGVIAVSDVMRTGLARKLFRGESQLLRVPLDAAASRMMRGNAAECGPVADALGTERATLVTHFLDAWRNFCRVFDH
jgi:hypothetical protein